MNNNHIVKPPTTIVLPGGSGGIGLALVKTLLDRFPEATIHATHFRSSIPFEDKRIVWQKLDIQNALEIEAWSAGFGRVDWLINCIGFLHDDKAGPEKSIRQLDPEFFMTNLKINALPTLLLAKYFSGALKKSSAPLLATISARVGSIEDNRLGGWYSYRISKAALNMAIKTLSIEWKHSHSKGCVAALHPGTNDTQLSKPFQSNVAPQNLFDPLYTAECLTNLLTDLDSSQSGKFWAWDGSNLPW